MEKYAFISVYDKRGLSPLVKALAKHGYKIISTGGTKRYLEKMGYKVIESSSFTGFDEILGGRVKTLHPKIHGGILARNYDELKRYSLPNIEVVIVNLYPFEDMAKKSIGTDKLIEYIDIGGVALIRAAAKNYKRVCVLTSPEDYAEFINRLERGIDENYRRNLALKAFARTAIYDAVIYNTLWNLWEKSFPDVFIFPYMKREELRYGENPHQRACFYVDGTFSWKQLHGRKLSFNNIYDVDSAYRLVNDLDGIACAIIKHGNPCGAAMGSTPKEAYEKALSGDKLSAYGGIVAFNTTVDEETAESMRKMFFECVIAPGYEEGALNILKKKKRLRIIEAERPKYEGYDIRKVMGGLLVQTWDRKFDESWELVSKREADEYELEDLKFAWRVVRHVRSNAIVFAKNLMTVGIGAGQMSRVDSVKIAAMKAGERARGAVMASDAFFPFPDAIEIAAEAGITAIVQPGGSIRDKEIIEKVNEFAMAMYFTGYRVFKHW